jgi:hypothetical protein
MIHSFIHSFTHCTFLFNNVMVSKFACLQTKIEFNARDEGIMIYYQQMKISIPSIVGN